MNYEQAVKKVRAAKTKENYLVIEMGYDNTIVLPHKDGIAFLNALTSAEQLEESYNKPHRINPIERNKIKTQLMAAEEYESFKIAALLNITPAEAKEFAMGNTET